jgi:hypothetical protein
VGAGAGPEAVGPQRARMRMVGDTFRMLADVTGNPMYRRLAEEAYEKGV